MEEGYWSGFMSGFFSALLAFIFGLIYQKIMNRERELLSKSLELIAKQTEIMNQALKVREKQMRESLNEGNNNNTAPANWRYGSSSNRNFLDAPYRSVPSSLEGTSLPSHGGEEEGKMNNKFIIMRGGEGDKAISSPVLSSSLSNLSPSLSPSVGSPAMGRKRFDKDKRKVQRFEPVEEGEVFEMEGVGNDDMIGPDPEEISRQELDELAEKYISEKDLKLIAEMRRNLPSSSDIFPPLYLDDFTLLRFLRARQLNTSKAVDMFRNFLVWREDYRPDLITLAEVREEIEKRKAHVHGYDNEGRPAVIIFAGRHNPKDTDTRLFSRFIVYFFTELTKCMRPPCEKVAIIFDYHGISRSNADIQLIKEIAPILQNSFPERIGSIYMVNHPFFLKTIFGLAKPFLDPNTVEKIQFLDVAKLSTLFPKRYLLKKHGGTSNYEPEGDSVGLETLHPSFNL